MWQLGAAANLVITVLYVGIAAAIVVPLVREKQLLSNRLGAATAAIFFTCAVHHGSHAVYAILPTLGVPNVGAEATREMLSWNAVVWDVFSAGVAAYYWSLRRTYGSLMRGAKLFEDMKERQRQALEINDNIVQGLFVAQTALALDDQEMSEQAMKDTLAAARTIISDLLGDAGTDMEVMAGGLRRKTAAEVVAKT